MSELRTVDVQEIVACAGEALSKVSSGAVKLDDVKVLSKDNRRNFIARATALYADGSARPVILKSTRSATYDPTAENVFRDIGPSKGMGCLRLPCRLALVVVAMVLRCWPEMLPAGSWFSRTLARISPRLLIHSSKGPRKRLSTR